MVANTLHFGWKRFDVKYGFAARTGAPATESRHDFFERQLVTDHGIKLEFVFFE
jgi:hypothetical protein